MFYINDNGQQLIDVTNVYNVYKKFFVNAFIILSTFISVKITWAKRSKIMTGSRSVTDWVHWVTVLVTVNSYLMMEHLIRSRRLD